MEGLYSIGEDELLYLLDLKKGEPLGRAALRRGIKRAFMKGIFEDISVEADEGREGRFIVRVKEKDFIKSVRVDGTADVSPGFIKENLGLVSGDALRYDLLESYKEKVLDLLRGKGYPNASVSVGTEKTRRPHRVRLVISVSEGRPLYIAEIAVLGMPASEVLPYLRLSANSVYDQFRLNEDIERLTRLYRERGHLNPIVGPYTFSDGVLHLNVNPGNRLKIKVSGNDSVRSKRLMEVMPFFDAGEIRDDLVDEAVARITSLYHTEGFPLVQAAAVMSAEEDDVVLNFFVYEGPRVRVKALKISGVTVPEENLKKVVSLREGSLYNPDLLGGDAQAIRDFYNALGYIDVSVSEPETAVEDGEASINITVKEGRKVVLTDLVIEGVSSLSEEEVRSEIRIEKGAPYNEVDILDARRRVVGLYRKHGFQGAAVDVERSFDGTGGATVVFVVREGAKLHFGKTLIRGNVSTRSEVIRREFEHKEGDLLDRAMLLGARQRIYKTGLFTDINTEVLGEYDGKADVVVDVEEGPAGTVEFGMGYGEYDRLRGFFDISYKNFFGMNRQGAFRTEASSLATRHILRYNEPWFLERRMPLRVYFIKENKKDINIDTGDVRYRVKRYTAGVGVEKELNDRVTVDLLYEFSFTDTTDVATDIILSKEDTGTLAVSSITPSMRYDTRDNPFDPRRGIYAGVSLKTATIALFSETDFFKLVGFSSGFKEISKDIVFAASVRGGLARGVGETTDLPLIERFFLGGRSTVRGFAQDTLGPTGPQGNPIGGNVFFLGNLEFRLGLAKNWRVVPFLDTGQVWLDHEDVDFSDLRYTAGLGLQYNTPVGPIRLDYGRKLDKKAGETSSEVHFSIGHAF